MNYFGPHYHSMSGHISYLRDLQPRLIKVIDPNRDALAQFNDLSPNSYTWARKYIPEHDLENRIRNNAREAAKFTIDAIEKYWDWGFDMASLQNEILVFDVEGLQIINEYHHEVMDLTPSGNVIVLGHINVGHPFQSPDDLIGGWAFLDSSLKECERLGHVFAIHAYGRPENLWYNSEWLVSRFENQTQHWFFEKYPHYLMAYGEFGTSDKLDNPTGKYGGHRHVMSDEDFALQLVQHGPYIAQWSNHFIGAALFDTNALHPFEKSEMREVLRYLTEYYKSNPLPLKDLVNIPGQEVDNTMPKPKKLYDARTTANLNMRDCPSSNCSVVHVIPQNTIVPVYSENGVWREVSYKNDIGHSHSNWLVKDEKLKLSLEERVELLELSAAHQETKINDLIDYTVDIASELEKTVFKVTELESEVGELKELINEGEIPDNPLPSPNTRVSSGFHASNHEIIVNEDDEWFIKDVFTTLDGSWEVGDQNSPYAIVQWARDAYLKPFGHPRYFDDAGAQTHALVLCLDKDGNIIDEQVSMYFWPDGSDSKSPLSQNKKSGWVNYLIGRNIYYPDVQQQGPFSVTLKDERAPTIKGLGLPYALHVSTFIVFQQK